MYQFNAAIRKNRPVARGFYEMSFSWDPSAPAPLPGQFFTLRVSDTTAPLLRRPFAFSGFDPDEQTASFIYQKRGTATEILAGKAIDETIDTIGPFGNSFDLNWNGPAIVLAGGIGLGPMIFLASALSAVARETVFVFGCRSREFIPPGDVFNSTTPLFCTDDGSEGFTGTVIDYLHTLPPHNFTDATIYACGPHVMLKAAHDFATAKNLVCEVSMEQTMACGVGACMGCVVQVHREPGFARVCKDGPIFKSGDIKWN